MIVDLVGGYDSMYFWILTFGLLLGGSILNVFGNIIIRAIGIGLFMFGGVELVIFTDFTLKNTSNLPESANIFPILFAVILILVGFKMAQYSSTTKKDNPSNEVDKS